MEAVSAYWVLVLWPVSLRGDTAWLGVLRAGSHFMPDGAIGQHLVRWVGRGRGKGRPSGNMTPKTKVSPGGQWAPGAMTCPLLLPFSSNSFFEVSPTPKDVNRSLSLLGVSRQQGVRIIFRGQSRGQSTTCKGGYPWSRNHQPHRTPRFRAKGSQTSSSLSALPTLSLGLSGHL